MRRTTCAGCGEAKLRPFLDLGSTPLADAYTADPTEVSKTYPLEVAVCEDCSLVQLLEDVDSATLFGTGYSFYSSSSPPLSAYHKQYAEQVISTLDDDGRQYFILEIGCNDGDMLRWFDALNCVTLGVDLASGPVDKARERGLTVVQKEFTDQLAHELRDEHGPADVVIANHVLAHAADVHDMLQGIKTSLALNGVAYVEVQYVADLLVNNAFDLIYHEHRNFFSLISLGHAAERAGLSIVDVQFTRRQQGSIRVKLRRSAEMPIASPLVSDKLDSEWWLYDASTYDTMQGRVERIRTRLWDLLYEAVKRGSVAGYGAPAKATTLLNFCDIDSNVLMNIVDETPAKQGRYVPGTGVMIMSPLAAALPDTYLLLAWNYAHEIISREWRHGRRWILPLPAPMLL